MGVDEPDGLWIWTCYRVTMRYHLPATNTQTLESAIISTGFCRSQMFMTEYTEANF